MPSNQAAQAVVYAVLAFAEGHHTPPDGGHRVADGEGDVLDEHRVDLPATVGLAKRSAWTRSRSRSICSGVAPSVRRMASVKARATSPSPENTHSAPAWYRAGRSRTYAERARTRMVGFSSRASRMTSALVRIPAALRMRLPALSTPASCNVSRWLASPYTAA